MRLDAESLSLTDTVNLVIRKSGLYAHYQSEKDGSERIENMREMLSATKGYLKNEGLCEDAPAFAMPADAEQTPIQGFLTQATLEAGDKNEQGDRDAVQLMTVHAAKGLEFSHVFIAGSEEGLFPHFSAINDTRGPGVDEERRLMYVAITRAKKKLVITNCQSRMQYGEMRSNEPSSFLSEIPEELLDQKDLCRRQYGYDDRSERRSRRDNGYSGWDRPSFGGSSRSGGYGTDRYESRSSSRDRDDWRQGLGGGNAGTYRSKEEPLVKRRAEAAAGEAFGYALGDSVEHKKFGFGTVEAITGRGSDMRITINFSNGGRKELLLQLAAKSLHKV